MTEACQDAVCPANVKQDGPVSLDIPKQSFGLVVQQKTRIFEEKSEEPTSLFMDQIFCTNIAFCIGQALLGDLLIVATIGIKGSSEKLGLSQDPDHCYLNLVFFLPALLPRHAS